MTTVTALDLRRASRVCLRRGAVVVEDQPPRRGWVRASASLCAVKNFAGHALAYGLMGVLYGYLVVYGPWADSKDRSWQDALLLGLCFAVVMAALERGRVWLSRRNR